MKIATIILGVIAAACFVIIKVSPDWPEWAENLVLGAFWFSITALLIISYTN